MKKVVSYRDDVHVWVYLDQIDKVIRYEAFVIGYDAGGAPTTLDFVLEEGVLDNVHEVPVFWDLLRDGASATYPPLPVWSTVSDSRLMTAPSLLSFYSALSPQQLDEVHQYFADQEIHLKQDRRNRWTRVLRALGYDVISSL